MIEYEISKDDIIDVLKSMTPPATRGDTKSHTHLAQTIAIQHAIYSIKQLDKCIENIESLNTLLQNKEYELESLNERNAYLESELAKEKAKNIKNNAIVKRLEEAIDKCSSNSQK